MPENTGKTEKKILVEGWRSKVSEEKKKNETIPFCCCNCMYPVRNVCSGAGEQSGCKQAGSRIGSKSNPGNDCNGICDVLRNTCSRIPSCWKIE